MVGDRVTHVLASETAVFDAELVNHRRVEAAMVECGRGWHCRISKDPRAAAEVFVEQLLGYSIHRVPDACARSEGRSVDHVGRPCELLVEKFEKGSATMNEDGDVARIRGEHFLHFLED